MMMMSRFTLLLSCLIGILGMALMPTPTNARVSHMRHRHHRQQHHHHHGHHHGHHHHHHSDFVVSSSEDTADTAQPADDDFKVVSGTTGENPPDGFQVVSRIPGKVVKENDLEGDTPTNDDDFITPTLISDEEEITSEMASNDNSEQIHFK